MRGGGGGVVKGWVEGERGRGCEGVGRRRGCERVGRRRGCEGVGRIGR